MHDQIVDFRCQLTLISISDIPDVAFGFRCIAKRLVSSSVDHLPTKSRVRYAWKSTLTLLCEFVRGQVPQRTVGSRVIVVLPTDRARKSITLPTYSRTFLFSDKSLTRAGSPVSLAYSRMLLPLYVVAGSASLSSKY
jgi:hypothetical protein